LFGREERIKLLRSVFEQQSSDSPEVRQQIPAWTADFLDVVQNRPLPPTSPMALSAIDPQMVCQRTTAWIAEAVAYDPAKIHFLVVGARHLHPNIRAASACSTAWRRRASKSASSRAPPARVNRSRPQQGAVVGPAQFTTQCVVNWKSHIKAANMAQVAHVKSFAEFGCQRLCQFGQQSLTVDGARSSSLLELNVMAAYLPASLHLDGIDCA
jgi:hypothetical protein